MSQFKLLRGTIKDRRVSPTTLPDIFFMQNTRYDDRISLDVIDFVTNHRPEYENGLAMFTIHDEVYENDTLRRCRVYVVPHNQSDITLVYYVYIDIRHGRFYPRIESFSVTGL